jgi:hypothetical protein
MSPAASREAYRLLMAEARLAVNLKSGARSSAETRVVDWYPQEAGVSSCAPYIFSSIASAVVLIATGCGENKAEVTDGFVRLSGGGGSYACPKDWQKLPASAEPEGWTATCEWHENNKTIGQVGVFTFQGRTMPSEVVAAEAAFLGLERKAMDVRRISTRPSRFAMRKAPAARITPTPQSSTAKRAPIRFVARM